MSVSTAFPDGHLNSGLQRQQEFQKEAELSDANAVQLRDRTHRVLWSAVLAEPVLLCEVLRSDDEGISGDFEETSFNLVHAQRSAMLWGSQITLGEG